MKHIYSQAEIAYIWLGDELASDQAGYQLMRKMYIALGKPEIDEKYGTQHFDFKD